MRYLGHTLFLIAGLVMMYFGYTSYVSSKDLVDHGSKTSGVVVDNVVSYDDEGQSYRPIVEFKHNGQSYQIQSDVGTDPPAYSVGDKVEILFPKDHPEKGQINDFWSLWFITVMLGGMGALFSVIGAGTLIAALKGLQNIGGTPGNMGPGQPMPPPSSGSPPPIR